MGKVAVYRLVESRDSATRLPAVKIGRRIRFDRAALEARVAERAR
jgi:hypothetical protein